MGARYLKVEEEILRSDFPTVSRKEILEKISTRTWAQLSAHARRMGIHRTSEAKGNSVRDGRKKLKSAYSDAENDRLRRMYPVASRKELLAAFPKRTLNALQAHAYVLGVKRTREAKAREVKLGRKNARKEDTR
jgi:hypothetical protein